MAITTTTPRRSRPRWRTGRRALRNGGSDPVALRWSCYPTRLKLTVPVQVPCPDVVNPQEVFGHYVGHEEPGVYFYSNKPGSGTRERYQLILPKSPPPPTPGMPVNARSYGFELQVAPWFMMAQCADRSFPELLAGRSLV